MKKVILTLFSVFLLASSLDADNKAMSNDEFMKQFLGSKKKLETSEEKAKIEREKLKKEQAETKALEEKAIKKRDKTIALEKLTKALTKAKNKKTTK